MQIRSTTDTRAHTTLAVQSQSAIVKEEETAYPATEDVYQVRDVDDAARDYYANPWHQEHLLVLKN